MMKTYKQLTRFLLVGGTAFLIDFIVFYIMIKSIGANYLYGNCVAFVISTIYTYVLSVFWIFDTDKKQETYLQFFGFIILSFGGLGVNQFIMWFLIETININSFISKIIATMIVMLYNFISRKYFLESSDIYKIIRRKI